MTWEAWLTLGLIVGLLVALLRNWAPADVALLAALTALVAAGELTGSQRLPTAVKAVAGMGNSGLITVAVLFVVVTSLSQTGAMGLIAAPWWGTLRPLAMP